MSKITIELYDTPQGPQWLAYPDVPWKGGRVFTAAEKIAHQLIMNLEQAVPILAPANAKQTSPVEKEKPKVEGNVVKVDFGKGRSTKTDCQDEGNKA